MVALTLKAQIFGGKLVHVMETAVDGVGKHPVDVCHGIKSPWCENEQAASRLCKKNVFFLAIVLDLHYLCKKTKNHSLTCFHAISY